MAAEDELEPGEGKPARATSPLGRALIYVTGLIVAAFVGAVFKEWWEAPDPRIEIVNFSIQNVEANDDTPISLSDDTNSQIESLVGKDPTEETDERRFVPYPPVTAGELRSRLRTIKSYAAGYDEAVTLTDELLKLVLSQNAQVSMETNRQVFVEQLFKNPTTATYVASALGDALSKGKSDLPATFSAIHTNAPNSFLLPNGATIYLATLGRDLQRAKPDPPSWGNRGLEARGLFERLLVSYDVNTLVKFLPRAKGLLADDATRIQGLISSIQQALDADRLGDFLMVEVVVSNRGGRPLNLRDMAILRLALLSDEGRYAPVPPIEMRSTSSGVTLIPGRESKPLTIWSEKSLNDLLIDNAYAALAGQGWTRDKPVRDSRLQRLLQDSKSAVLAELILARAGDSAKIAIKSEKSYPVSTDKLWKILQSQ